jgi:hypothetical protein
MKRHGHGIDMYIIIVLSLLFEAFLALNKSSLTGVRNHRCALLRLCIFLDGIMTWHWRFLYICGVKSEESVTSLLVW